MYQSDVSSIWVFFDSIWFGTVLILYSERDVEEKESEADLKAFRGIRESLQKLSSEDDVKKKSTDQASLDHGSSCCDSIAGKIDLFIDIVQTLIGSGTVGRGNKGSDLDIGNLLKPSLGSGEIQCIASTTMDEYQMHFETDTALARRFQPVLINEPSQVLESKRNNLDEASNMEDDTSLTWSSL